MTSMTMKRLNSEQINSFVHNFLKRRNYSDHNTSRHHKKPPNINNSRAMKSMDTKAKESLEEIALNGSVVNATSDADATTWSLQAGADFAANAEAAFKSFIEFVAKFKSKQRLFEQLSQLEFPIFLYIFIELFDCGHKMSARRFLRDHKNRFKESIELQTIDLMSKSLNAMTLDPNLQKYKTSKYCVKISDKCLEQMKRHLKETNDLIIVQIISKSIDLNSYSTHNQIQTETNEKRVEKSSQFMDSEPLSAPDVQLSQTQTKGIQDFLDCVEKLRNSPPCRPPIRTFTVNSEDLCCAAVTDDMSALALGFTDSRICLKRFGQNFNSESRFELRKNTSEIHINLIEHDIEDEGDEDCGQTPDATNGANNCDTNSSAAEDTDNDDSYRTLRGHSGCIYGLTFCPRTDILLSCSKDTTVRAWDATSGHNVAAYNSHKSSVWALDSSLIGNLFCSGGDECVAYLWSLERSQPVRMFVTNSSCVHCLRFHHNCKYVAFAEREITLWDVDKAQEVRTFVGHEAPVHSLSFSLCGQYLASGGMDRKVIVWDIGSGKSLKVFTGHSNAVYSVCFDHNNTLLSSCGADQTLKLWNLKNTINSLSNKPLVADSETNQNTARVESDQFMSYQMNSKLIHSQFLPRNLLLTIGKTC
ncbi:unnamed protein product [Oppiella nova]|uniref:TFIID subunit TAF5 NTD2 domain-containing protein n=1 Tax=Oppiella nova TaxID=334625 RepID=A0A7R9LRQ6_9ACAR|nr:unnamed protein product [Oppiella nova]CAG2165709.1 unnamed protein product [Oppiella nova]